MLALVALVVAPVLWLAGALDEVEWGGDVVTGLIVTVAVYASISLGFVLAQRRAALYLWTSCVAVVLLQQASWTDDPARSGIDDLPPAFVLPFTPLVAVLPLLGVGLQRKLSA